MTTQCVNSFDTVEPPTEWMIHLVDTSEGWDLRLTHRHRATRFGQCPVEHVNRLTIHEAADVILAVLELEIPPF